ncbi:UNVERIFIED_CONTAM: hypothetical protein GTU68_017857 [Idotea baltica]|nr:hypothetical protein [Idotea baltica]
MAGEGLNGTVSGALGSIKAIAEGTEAEQAGRTPWFFKDGLSDKDPFKRFKVKLRKEIVTTGFKEAYRVDESINSLTPEEWHAVLSSDEEYELIDVRNYYETELGKFRGATDPNLVHFKHFGEFVDKAEIPKDKKVLMYCTGGIRCEKAIFEMLDRGYDDVSQLKGGILDYLKKYPNKEFEGECFVFDQRVSVDQALKPSERFVLCPHCGQPGELEINCERCDSKAKICDRCAEKSIEARSCGKNCSYQLQRAV